MSICFQQQQGKQFIFVGGGSKQACQLLGVVTVVHAKLHKGAQRNSMTDNKIQHGQGQDQAKQCCLGGTLCTRHLQRSQVKTGWASMLLQQTTSRQKAQKKGYTNALDHVSNFSQEQFKDNCAIKGAPRE